MKKTTCSVVGCGRPAIVMVILYDLYLYEMCSSSPKIFFEKDFTCPFLCGKHLIENEEKSRGVRKPRGSIRYPYSNKHSAQGFSIYVPLSEIAVIAAAPSQ